MVSLIILSYNTASLLTDCLSSVYKNVHDLEFEVIVVDNNSTDHSVHLVKTRYPNVRVIESSENLGFAKGVNLGVKNARGDLVLLLNSDTRLNANSVRKMVDFINSKNDIAVVGGKLKNKDGSTSSSFSSFYTLFQIFLFLFAGNKEKIIKKPSPVDWVSGGFMLFRKDVFVELNGFDPHFFMYIEDMEFCYRLKKKGYKVYYNPKAWVEHVGQGSSNRSFAIIQIYKGLLYFYRKHRKSEYGLVKAMLFVKAVISLCVGYLTNNIYLKSTYSKVLSEAL